MLLQTQPGARSPRAVIVVSSSYRSRRAHRIPTAAKCPENSHSGPCGTRTVGFELILGGQQLPVRIEDIRQGDGARSISLFRKIPRSNQGLHLVLQLDHVHLRLRERHQGILDVLRRAQDRLTVVRECLCIGATGLIYLSIDLAEVENSPADSTRPSGLQSFRYKQVATACRIPPQSPRQRYLGVVIGNSSANPLVRGGQPPLSGNDVRPPAKHITGMLLAWQSRDGRDSVPSLKFTSIGPRLFAHQHVKAI